MGFEKIDKAAEEVQQKVNQEFSNEPSVLNNAAQTPLTNAENEDLTQELSGESQGLGFTDAESNALTNGLSGNLSSAESQLSLYESGYTQTTTENKTQFIDENKILKYRALLDKLKTLSPDSDEYYILLSEIEQAKIGLMNESEQANYLTTKFWNAYNNNNLSAWENILNAYYDYKYNELETKFGVDGAKEFIKEHTNLGNLIAYINVAANNSKTKISKAELIWETIKTVVDTIEEVILSDTNLQDILNDTAIISALKNNSNPVIAGAISAYLGRNVKLTANSDNNITSINPEKILTNEEIEFIIAEFKNITAKEFRSKIGKINTIHGLNIIDELIEATDYSKAEKQMLKKELTKQQGIIQTAFSDDVQKPEENEKIKIQDIENERIKSLLEYDIFNQCKTPAQRKMAQIILSDSRIYLAHSDSQKIFSEIIELCINKSDVEAKIRFIEKIITNPKFLNDNGAINKYLIACIKDINSNNIDEILNFLDEYNNNNSAINGYDFSQKLYNSITKPILYSAGNYNINIDNENLNDETSDLVNKILYNIEQTDNVDSKNSLIELGTRILNDKELIKDNTSLRIFAEFILSTDRINPDIRVTYLECVYNALKIGYEKKAKEDEILTAIAKLQNLDFSEFLNRFTKNKNIQCSNIVELAASRTLEKKIRLFESFTTGRSYTDELLYDLLQVSQKTYCIDILQELSKRKEFSAKDIIKVANLTSKNTVDITQKVLSKSDLTSEEKVDVLTAIQANREQIELIKLIISKDELNLKSLPKILKSIKILDEHHAGRKYERINLSKLDEYTTLLQNPKTEKWVINMLNQGIDIETISNMNPYKHASYFEEINGSVKQFVDENIKLFIELGMNKNQAEKTVQAITKNNIINTDIKQTAIEMIKSGVPKDIIGDILISSDITGIYNPHITADAMSVLNMGLSGFMERYLPIINNLSAEEISNKFSPSMRNKLHEMITQIPDQIVRTLQIKGFDVDNILKKLNTDNKKEINNNDFEFRDIAELSGLEKYLIDKYAPNERIWSRKSNTKDWAEEKYLIIKENYLQTKVNNDNTEKERSERLETWFNYLETNPDIKNNTFAKLILAEFFTKDSMSKGSQLPPKFDMSLAENIISDILKSNTKKEQDENNKNPIAKATEIKTDNKNETSDKTNDLKNSDKKIKTERQDLSENQNREDLYKKKLDLDI